jgi:hypothetical protein
VLSQEINTIIEVRYFKQLCSFSLTYRHWVATWDQIALEFAADQSLSGVWLEKSSLSQTVCEDSCMTWSNRLLVALFMIGLLCDVRAELRITEFMTRGLASLADEDGEMSDWIEITNTSASETESLGGWHLTDQEDALAQWAFPDQSLGPGELLVVFASGKDRYDAILHTNFKLGSGGGYLALVRPDGVTVEHAFESYPRQRLGYSYGLAVNGEETVFFKTPTPGDANGDGVSGFVADTKFSVDRGLYTNSFLLEITTATEDATIRYTTDGSVPTIFSGKTYDEPVEINRTSIIRALAQKQGFEPSNLDTQTYLFLEDVVDQNADRQAPEGWPSGSVNGQRLHFGMNPDVIDRVGRERMAEALGSLPSFSIVTDQASLFDSKNGIYVNASERGRDWERPASLELLPSKHEPGFQIDCGVRVRGGVSRNDDNPKHSFRVLFRREYGASRLDYPLFGDLGASSFSNIDIRSSQNWTWAWFGEFPAGARQNTLLRDITSRDLQGALGQQHARSEYYHLYVNGVYWGIYMTDERTEAEYAETYFGGDEANYDVIKIDPSRNYQNENPDGNMDAWRDLWEQGRAHADFPEIDRYLRMQGLNPDGSRNPDYPVLLDVDNLIDYLLNIYYTANNDAPVSQWFMNDSGNNWYGIRDRERGDQGFRFFVHDAENTFGIRGYDFSFSRVITTDDRTGPFTVANRSSFNFSNPQFLHQDLMGNAAYRIRFADRVQKHLFDGGALTEEAVRARLQKRIDALELPILAHAARWGWSTAGRSYDEEDWRKEVDRIIDFVANRNDILIEQLVEDDLYRDIVPILNHDGGTVSSEFVLTIESPKQAHVVYHTTDGTDPKDARGRNIGMSGDTSITLTESMKIRARIQPISLFRPEDGCGPLLERIYYVDSIRPSPNDLVVSEIHYRPSTPTEGEISGGFRNRSDFEYLAIENRGDDKLILDSVRVVGGIRFEIPDLTELEAGERVLIVNDLKAFEFRYGTHAEVVGAFDGDLSNGGERIALLDLEGTLLLDFVYDDTDPWPTAADGEGESLVFKTEAEAALQGDPVQWVASPAISVNPTLLNDLNVRLERDAQDGFVLTWNSERGFVYQVQGSRDLETWIDEDLPSLDGTGGPLMFPVEPSIFSYLRLSIASEK